MRKSRLIYRLVIIVVLIIALIVYLLRSPIFTITDINYTSFNKETKDISLISSELYKNYFTFNKFKVEDEFESLAYIKNAKIKYKYPSTLNVDLTFNEDILLLVTEDEFTIYDGVFTSIDEEDSSLIASGVYPIEISQSYLDYLKKYSTDENFEYLIKIMNSISYDYIDLISKIKYNNINNFVKGSLIIELEEINSTIEVRDNVSSKRIEEAISLVNNFYLNGQNDGINNVNYILYSTALVKR